MGVSTVRMPFNKESAENHIDTAEQQSDASTINEASHSQAQSYALIAIAINLGRIAQVLEDCSANGSISITDVTHER